MLAWDGLPNSRHLCMHSAFACFMQLDAAVIALKQFIIEAKDWRKVHKSFRQRSVTASARLKAFSKVLEDDQTAALRAQQPDPQTAVQPASTQVNSCCFPRMCLLIAEDGSQSASAGRALLQRRQALSPQASLNFHMCTWLLQSLVVQLMVASSLQNITASQTSQHALSGTGRMTDLQ